MSREKYNIYTEFQGISGTKPPKFHIPWHIPGQKKGHRALALLLNKCA